MVKVALVTVWRPTDLEWPAKGCDVCRVAVYISPAAQNTPHYMWLRETVVQKGVFGA